jgi:hypothetical protein
MTRWVLVLVVALASAFAHAESLRSKDGKIQFTLPNGWEPAPANSPMRQGFLTPDAKIFARSGATMGFAVAFREAKEDLTAKTLADYVAVIMKLEQRKFPNRVVGTPKKVELAGREALRYEIRSEHNGVNLIYVKTFMDAAKHWVQITCWTTPSHKKELDGDCATIVASFQEATTAK